MLTTPLLAAMQSSFSRAQFDWAVSEWARPAVATNPRLSKLINSGRVGLPDCTWAEVREFVACLRQEQYDTCLIPSRSSLLSLVAWLARIPQRVGLNVQGRGFAHRWAVRVPMEGMHEAAAHHHRLLCEMVGATRESIALAFGRLVGAGVVERKGMAFVMSPKDLAAHISGSPADIVNGMPVVQESLTP